MSMQTIDARNLAQAGADALRRGDARTARALFEQIIVAGQDDTSVCLGLTYACRRLGDKTGALAGVDRALAREPRNLRAVILKADVLADAGDIVGASSFYQYAVKIAPPSDQMPAELRDEFARAKAMHERYLGQFARFLEDRLVRGGLSEGPSGDRFRHSLDILLGRKTIYYQQPRVFYFAELPQVQFYDRSAFPWLNKVEAATEDIRAELIEVMKEDSAFQPYVQHAAERPRKDLEGLDHNPDWSAFYMWKDGEIVPENAARCPRTMQVINETPLSCVRNRSPSVLFSLLRPGARIPPHSGLVNTRLICHLPLIVPPDCGFRVGNDVRTPVEGKAWAFDDTIEHEAWNNSNRTRVILLFETWRPELTEQERHLVSTMFEAIDSYSGQKPAWSI